MIRSRTGACFPTAHAASKAALPRRSRSLCKAVACAADSPEGTTPAAARFAWAAARSVTARSGSCPAATLCQPVEALRQPDPVIDGEELERRCLKQLGRSVGRAPRQGDEAEVACRGSDRGYGRACRSPGGTSGRWYTLFASTSANRREERIMTTLIDRITIDPAICHGKPCVRGLRYPVEFILGLLSAGMTIDEILADYADLEREDILAALEFARRLSQTKSIQSLVA